MSATLFLACGGHICTSRGCKNPSKHVLSTAAIPLDDVMYMCAFEFSLLSKDLLSGCNQIHCLHVTPEDKNHYLCLLILLLVSLVEL